MTYFKKYCDNDASVEENNENLEKIIAWKATVV